MADNTQQKAQQPQETFSNIQPLDQQAQPGTTPASATPVPVPTAPVEGETFTGIQALEGVPQPKTAPAPVTNYQPTQGAPAAPPEVPKPQPPMHEQGVLETFLPRLFNAPALTPAQRQTMQTQPVPGWHDPYEDFKIGSKYMTEAGGKIGEEAGAGLLKLPLSAGGSHIYQPVREQPSDVSTGIAKGVGGFVGGFVSDPVNVAMLASGAEGPILLRKAADLYFMAQGAEGTRKQFLDLAQNWDKLTPEQKAEELTSGALQAFLLTQAGRDMVHGTIHPTKEALKSAADWVATNKQAQDLIHGEKGADIGRRIKEPKPPRTPLWKGPQPEGTQLPSVLSSEGREKFRAEPKGPEAPKPVRPERVPIWKGPQPEATEATQPSPLEFGGEKGPKAPVGLKEPSVLSPRTGYPAIETEPEITKEKVDQIRAEKPAAEAKPLAEEKPAPTEEKPKGRIFYHGSDASGASRIDAEGQIYNGFATHLTPDRSTAEAYAKMKGGKVHEVREEDVPPGVLDHFNETGRGPIEIPRGVKVPTQGAAAERRVAGGERRVTEGQPPEGTEERRIAERRASLMTPTEMQQAMKEGKPIRTAFDVTEGASDLIKRDPMMPKHPAEEVAERAKTQKELSPDDVVNSIQGRRDHAILTSENPNNTPLTPEANARRMKALGKLLTGMGFKPVPVVGHMPQGLENSFYVEGMDPKTAADIGKRFEQAAVVTGEGLHDLANGKVYPYKTEGHPMLDDEARKQEYYSTVKGADGKERAFSHQVDFDKGEPENRDAVTPPPKEPPKVPPRESIDGGQSADPKGTYHEASQGKGNPWVRRSADPANDAQTDNSKRQLMVQIASDLIYKETDNLTPEGEDVMAQKYYDKLYSGAREGYARMADFWEIPQWIGFAAHMFPDADVYVVRDVDEAVKFLNEAKYPNVAFSALDVNKNIIRRIAQGYRGHIDIGGYVDRNFYFDLPHVKWHDNLASLAKDLNIEPRNGVDYRHFQGSDVIPRITLSDGCLHQCAFCAIPKEIKLQDPASVKQQTEAIANLGSKLVYISDKTFGQAKNHTDLIEMNKQIRAKNPNFQGFVVQTTAAQMNKISPEFMKDAGIKYIELGIESYNDPILKEMKKPATEKIIDKATDKLRENGIILIPNIIIGYPGETTETYNRTLQWMKDNRDIISHANVYNLALYKDTKLGQKMTTATDGDFNENVLEKSWHNGSDIHKTFAGNLYGLATELLGQKPYDIARPDAKIADTNKPEQLTMFDFGKQAEAKPAGPGTAGAEEPGSQEAINRAQSQKAQGIKTYRVDTRSHKATPISGVDAPDAKANAHEKIVQIKGDQVTEMDSGAGAQPLNEAKLLENVKADQEHTVAQEKKLKETAKPKRDTQDILHVVQNEPEWKGKTLSEQLMEAGRRAQKAEQAAPEAESGGQHYSTVEGHVGDLTNNNLRELAKGVGIDPAKYDFSKRVPLREGGQKHPVERQQLIKDIMTKLKPEDIERIGEQSAATSAENVGGAPARAQKARAADAEKLLSSLWKSEEKTPEFKEGVSLEDYNKEIKDNPMGPLYRVGEENLPGHSEAELKKNKMYSNGEGAFYSISPDGNITRFVNNSKNPMAIADALKSAIENGGTKIDAWDTPRSVGRMYEGLGFKKGETIPFDEKTYGAPSKDLKEFWKKQGWKEGDPYPNVQVYEHSPEGQFEGKGPAPEATPETAKMSNEELLKKGFTQADIDAGKHLPKTGGGTEEPAKKMAGMEKIPEKITKHFLSQEEAGLKTEASQRAAAQKLLKLPKLQEWIDIANLGAGERKWYQRGTEAVKAIAEQLPEYFNKPEDTDNFLNVLASLSPRQEITENFTEAIRAWKELKDAERSGLDWNEKLTTKPPRGYPESAEWTRAGKILWDNIGMNRSAKIPNALKGLGKSALEMWPDLSKNRYFKVPSFAANLAGFLDRVTSDGWMAAFSGLKESDLSNPSSYHPLAVMTRAAAEELGWDAAEAQSAIWAVVKTLTEKGETEPAEIRKYSKDFADIAGSDAQIRAMLEDMGVDLEKLDDRLKTITEKPEVSSRTTPSSEDSVRKLTQRLERQGREIPEPRSSYTARDLDFGEEDTSFNPYDFGKPKKGYGSAK